MHQTRNETLTQLPIPRKGTKYVARAANNNNSAVPVVIALRDMLELARTAKEVKEMVKSKVLKHNWKEVKDLNEAIQLFHILEADKTYQLTLNSTGKFALEEVSKQDARLCKVVSRTLVSGNKIQLNLHDGSNVVTSDKISVGDSVYIDSSGKIKKKIALDKGAQVIVIKGKYSGERGTVKDAEGKSVTIQLNDKEGATSLDRSQVVAL